MTHDELLEQLKQTLIQEEMEQSVNFDEYSINQHAWKALIAVVELHKNNGSKYTLGYGQVAIELCEFCRETYPCQTIQAIEKELG